MPLFYGDERANNLVGTSLDDRIFARGGNDTVFGLGGKDQLQGGSGDDLLYGGALGDGFLADAGNDTLFGGSGDDYFTLYTSGVDMFGGDGIDTARYRWNDPDAVTIDLVKTFRIGGAAQGNTYDSVENLEGARGDDYLGGDAKANKLSGWGGDDVIDGRGGDNFLDGFTGNDTLIADGGDDIAFGGTGNDVIKTRGGNDTIIGGGGADKIYGGAGRDLVRYSDGDSDPNQSDAPQLSVSVDLVKTKNIGGYAEGDRYKGIEDVMATNGDDYVGGSSDGNQIFGRDGDDVLDGRAGDDTIFGGNGNDRLIADWDDDVFFGGNGNDLLESRGGNDTLEGGGGNDTLFGGRGEDVFRYRANDGEDVIKDFDVSQDVLLIAGMSFGDEPGQTDVSEFIQAVGQIDGNDAILNLDDDTSVRLEGVFPDPSTATLELLVPTLRGGDEAQSEFFTDQEQDHDLSGTLHDDRLTGTIASEKIVGLSGDDFLIGYSGDDTLVGGAGADTFYQVSSRPIDPSFDESNDEPVNSGNDVILDFELGTDSFISRYTITAANNRETEDVLRPIVEEIGTIQNGTDLLLELTTGTLSESVLFKDIVTEEMGDEAGDYWQILA